MQHQNIDTRVYRCLQWIDVAANMQVADVLHRAASCYCCKQEYLLRIVTNKIVCLHLFMHLFMSPIYAPQHKNDAEIGKFFMLWDETILGAKKEGEKKEESSCCLRRIECKQKGAKDCLCSSVMLLKTCNLSILDLL